ncbi:DUF429 domain-containing protein [Pontibacter anaerobius]|uniref:DUF429 domain-containing protein n=1 Tax=Pontibacter anaerobius TaxID=2993940 RepID=A0ABT3RB75_9BACT|nr:DUF429 domain-containing protein [Pontibacter anaerobius]MCX2739118.1 DUF429 domain-containing protein [Pontibacter anaerobius]
MQDNHLGVDYGSKMAGTTAVAMVQNGELYLWQCAKDKDADLWLQGLVQELKPAVVYIDAPLTLPMVYSQDVQTPESDFFYRQADREVQAMSPMFIGGLTARAMKLRTQLAAKGTAMLETYPTQAVKLLLPHLQGYKKEPAALQAYAEALQGQLKYPLRHPAENWHQIDAILCWLSGFRHNNNKAILYGRATEGRIIV